MLPVEIGQLANLTIFDLKDCPNVKYPKPLMRDNSKRVLAFFSKLFQMKQNQFGVSDIVDANDPPTWMAFIAFCTKAEFAGSLYKAVKHCPSLANLKDDDSGSTIRVLFEVFMFQPWQWFPRQMIMPAKQGWIANMSGAEANAPT